MVEGIAWTTFDLGTILWICRGRECVFPFFAGLFRGDCSLTMLFFEIRNRQRSITSYKATWTSEWFTRSKLRYTQISHGPSGQVRGFFVVITPSKFTESCQHNFRVTKLEHLNQMSCSNLAIVFGPNLLGPPPQSSLPAGAPNSNYTQLADTALQCKCVETILEHFEEIFVDAEGWLYSLVLWMIFRWCCII